MNTKAENVPIVGNDNWKTVGDNNVGHTDAAKKIVVDDN